jgi:putative nucleotidyltransferase with HDIG domain
MSVSCLAAGIAGRERETAAALRLRFARENVPLAVNAVVDAFVRRAAASGTDEGYGELQAWLRAVCSSYGDVPGLRGVLLEMPAAIASVLPEGAPAVPAAESDTFANDVETIVARSWRPLRRVRHEPLDEIDSRIDALVVRLEMKDLLTSEHSRAVAAWCTRLARRLGLDAGEVTFAARCGLLHDIGKVATPSEVLNAPRALNEREWVMMRAHAAAGEGIVRGIRELRVFAPAVRSHHERLDGRGYPDGLPASAIPLMARIVAVADCFNAMIGRRPYRLPMAPPRALEELTKNRGSQFDPEIVDAMVDVVLGL